MSRWCSVAERKAALERQQGGPPEAAPPPAPAPVPSAAAPTPSPALVPAAAATATGTDPPPQPKPEQSKPKDKSGIKKGWLSSGTLYPEGSTEAAPHLWRSKDIVGRKGKIFSLEASDAGYEIRGTFKEAGRFLGKEDFEVTRTGLTLRIRGHPDADAQSLVKGLDEHVTLPADADFSHISADYTDAVLTIKLGVNLQLRDAIQQLSPEEAQALAQKHGIASPPAIAGRSDAGQPPPPTNTPYSHPIPAAGGGGGVVMGHQAIGGYNAEDDEANARAALAAARVSHEAEERQQLGATWWARIGQTVGLSVRAAGPEHTRNLPSGGQGGGPAVASLEATAADAKALCAAMCAEGYSELHLEAWTGTAAGGTALQLTSFARAIDHLATLGLPPAFLMVFDEPWDAVAALSTHLAPVLGVELCHDVLVGNVKPGGHGRPMRRDRPGGNSKRAFTEEGLPKRCTVSVALTSADPKTSCVYAIPAPSDPHYRCAPDADAATARDDADLQAIFAAAHTRVRALPVEAGGCLIWSHRLIHWESAHGGSEGTCKTLAFGMADASSQASLLVADDGEPPPFNARLALIALRLVAEHHVEPLPKRLIPFVLGALRQSAPLLSREALSLGSATGGAFQRNLVAIHDELLDLASSFAGLAASGTPMATNAQGAAAHSPQEQAAAAASARLTAEVSMAHAVTCGAIASHIVSVRGLEATTSLRRVASLPTERALEPTDAMGGATPAPASETAAALANASSTAAVTKNATHVAKQPSVGVSEIEPVVTGQPSRFEEVD